MSFHVICTRPNASHLISGVAFKDCVDGGVETVEPIEAEDMAKFCDADGVPVPGFEVVDLNAAPVAPAEPVGEPVTPVTEPEVVPEPVVVADPPAPVEPPVVEPTAVADPEIKRGPGRPRKTDAAPVADPAPAPEEPASV